MTDNINLITNSGHCLLSQQDMLSHVHTTPSMTEVLLLQVHGCGTSYRLSYNRTSAMGNSDDNWKHFFSGL